MNIWIVVISEPLPIDADAPRLLRAGILSRKLAEAGHRVTWWNSNFHHVAKRKRFDTETTHQVSPNQRIILLDGISYPKNISFRRMINHRQVASSFARRARTEGRPDLILCSLPVVELADEAAKFGRELGIPVVLDIRDLWPDVIVDVAPKKLRPLAELLLSPMRNAQRRASRDAAAIIGLTTEYRDWALHYAGRKAGPNDRIFPLAYASEDPPAAALEEAYAFWTDQKVGLPGEMTVAFFGTMGKHFETELLFPGIELADRMKLPVKFVFCGVGDRLPALQTLAKKVGNIHIPGWMNAAQIWTLMRIARLGLAPYINTDNFRKNIPNKIIEYLSAGLPLLTNMEGVVAELIASHDIGFVYDSPQSFAEHVAKAIADPEAVAAKSRNVNVLFEQRFSADKVYEDMIQHLQNLAEAGV